MEAQEIDATLDELENRLDRLRSLYEQYFLGIEKIEPQVARKDVDRRFWMLRKTVIRNTARRFRMQVLIQRYNTFQQHWARICREIENGTYVRHLLKVKKNFGDEPKTWAARKRLGLLRKGAAGEGAAAADEGAAAADQDETSSDLAGVLTGGDLDAEVLAATAAAFESVERPRPARPAAHQRFSLDDLGPLNLDFDDDGQPTLPPKPPAAAPTLPKPAVPSSPTTRVAGAARVPTFPPPVPIGDAPKPPGLPQKPPVARPGAAAAPGARPPLPARPPIPGAPRVPTGLVVPPAAAARAPTPAEPFPPAPSSPASSPPPRPRVAVPAARPPLPGAPTATNGVRPAAARLPLPGAPGSPPLARPATAPIAPRAAPPNAAPLAPAAQSPRPVAPRTPEPKPNPAAPPRQAPPAPPAGAKDLSDDRLKQLHRELIETKKKLNLESTLSLDALTKSLRDTERKLRAEHQGRAVDFQVVVKDGKAVVKPIVRK